MNLTFTPSAWDDYQWFQQQDRKLLKRINQLIQDILRTPFERNRKARAAEGRCLADTGLGTSTTSIDLVYTVKANAAIIIACRYHYSS